MKKFFIFLSFIPLLAEASPQGVPALTIATGIASSGTATQVLAANRNRGYLLLQNTSGGNCYVAPVTFTGTSALKVSDGQNYEPVEAFIKSAWYAVCTAGTGSLTLLEANW